MPSLPAFSDYVTTKRADFPSQPKADIRTRWIERIVPRGLQLQGDAGALAYLRDYGRGISVGKILGFVHLAESEGCQGFANGMWAAAYKLEYGSTPTGAPIPAPVGAVTSPSSTGSSTAAHSFPELPKSLQPGSFLTMQPIDAPRSRSFYIASLDYIGQPKRDGNRIVVFASATDVCYQSRSTKITATPDDRFDGAFRLVAAEIGTFVLDGEKVYLDAAGDEHRTGSQAATANMEAGNPKGQVRCVLAIFKAIYDDGEDWSTSTDLVRIRHAETIVPRIAQALMVHGDDSVAVEMVPTAWTPAEKQALCELQEREGREGEVWVRASTEYLPGKAGEEVMVRTKYLTETDVVVTALTATTVAGRAFGAIEVAEVDWTGTLQPVGSVGTGFSAADAKAIAKRFAAKPGLKITVRHQGKTEGGQLWHARFVDFAA